MIPANGSSTTVRTGSTVRTVLIGASAFAMFMSVVWVVGVTDSRVSRIEERLAAAEGQIDTQDRIESMRAVGLDPARVLECEFWDVNGNHEPDAGDRRMCRPAQLQRGLFLPAAALREVSP